MEVPKFTNNKQKKSILFVLKYFPPYTIGGAEISTSYIVSYVSKNYRCYVLTSNLSKKNWKIYNSTVYPLLQKVDLGSRSLKELINYGIGIISVPFFNFFRIIKFIDNHNIDVVHIMGGPYEVLPALLAGIYKHKAIVLDARDYQFICVSDFSYFGFIDNDKRHSCLSHIKNLYNVKNNYLNSFLVFPAFYELTIFKLYNTIIKFLVNHSQHIKLVCVSNYVKKKLETQGFNKDKLLQIYNISTVLKTNTRKQAKKNTIIYAGRLEKSKGIWDLLYAMKSINNPNLKLNVVGEGLDREKIEEYIKKNKLDNINLLGKLPYQEVLKQYTQSRIIVAPSVRPEPFGRYILESFEAEVPLITTKSGGSPEVINSYRNGILVKSSNFHEIAEAINLLLIDKKMHQKIVKNIKKDKFKFSAKYIGEKRIESYKNLLKE